MAFQRNTIINTPINNTFVNTITQFANVTTNIPYELRNTAEIIGIDNNSLSRIVISTDPLNRECFQLIQNLSETLSQYNIDAYPQQLTERINQIRQLIDNLPVDDNTIPSYFSLISPPRRVIIINHTNNNFIQNIDNDFYDDFIGNLNDELSGEELEERVELVRTIVIDDNIKDDACPICLSHLRAEIDDTITSLNCNHQFHTTCIDSCLECKLECPLCRMKF
uniref:RING-type E3 ubiquitin transferase n=1 Tax=viral metagenome TaxID=1070528 RepID=A0A6C0D9M1_9ZZZZ